MQVRLEHGFDPPTAAASRVGSSIGIDGRGTVQAGEPPGPVDGAMFWRVPNNGDGEADAGRHTGGGGQRQPTWLQDKCVGKAAASAPSVRQRRAKRLAECRSTLAGVDGVAVAASNAGRPWLFRAEERERVSRAKSVGIRRRDREACGSMPPTTTAFGGVARPPGTVRPPGSAGTWRRGWRRDSATTLTREEQGKMPQAGPSLRLFTKPA
jgi:hypothetical protein